MFIADILLNEISRSVAVLDVAKNGVTYITENLDGVDYLIGASVGGVSSKEGDVTSRMTPRDSNSSIVRESYNYMVGHFGVSNDMLSGALEYPFGVNFTGSVFEGIGHTFAR